MSLRTASAVRRTFLVLLVSFAATVSGLAQTSSGCPLRGSCNLEPSLVGRTDLLLFEDWEASNWQTHWTSVVAPWNMSAVSSPVFAGTRSGEVRVPAGAHDGATLNFDFTAAGLPADPEEMYFRYYLRFNGTWQRNADGEIGKLPGFGGTYNRCGWGGRRADGTCWSARMAGYDTGATNQVGFYTYHADMLGSFGEHMRWPRQLQRNRWYCVEARVRMNTITGSFGSYDGILEGWIDDEPVFSRTNLRFRDSSATGRTTKIETIWGNVYVGGDWTADRDMRVHFDNAVIARNRIGCAGLPSPPPP
jgi:hypothetical protein